MDGLISLSIADWPERIGTNWYAISGTGGVVLVFIVVGIVTRIFFRNDSEHD